MPTVKELKLHLDKMPDDKVIAWDLWQVDDAFALWNQIHDDDDDAGLSQESAEDAIEEMHARKDATVGFSWYMLEVALK